MPSKEKYLAEQQAVSYPAFPLTYLKLESSFLSTGWKECSWVEIRIAGNYIRNVKCSFVHWMVCHQNIFSLHIIAMVLILLQSDQKMRLSYYLTGIIKNTLCYDQALAIFMLQPSSRFKI